MNAQRQPLRDVIVIVASWLICVGLCGVVEWKRMAAAAASPAGVLSWFADWNAETTLPGLVLLGALLLPAMQRTRLTRRSGVRRRIQTAAAPPEQTCASRDAPRRIIAVLLGALSFGSSALIGDREITYTGVSSEQHQPFSHLPYAYHDEFSYRLQAETFATGRWSYPGAPVAPELFHQFHVLNEPVTASRYFPWTGLWIAPFLSGGNSFYGHWLAGAIAVGLFFLVLSRYLPLGWAVAGGCLLAVSPGIAVFSNLLLSHHPTLMALAVFLWGYDALLRTKAAGYALISGVGLSLAMLARPMTAAGFAFPFGCVLIVVWWRDWRRTVATASAASARADAAEGKSAVSLAALVLMGLPLLAGFMVLGVQNQQITGVWYRSPYQAYTDQFTPRHRYGFGNAEDAEVTGLPDALLAYNDWATNLTPEKAAENVARRLLASLQWTLGLVPLCFGGMLSVLCLWDPRQRLFVGLLWAAFLSLHLAHVPYWYDGIMHWHYVFETAPLLIMIAVCGWYAGAMRLSPLLSPAPLSRAADDSVAFPQTPGAQAAAASLSARSTRPSRIICVWLTLLVAAGLAPGWVDAESAWGASKVSMAVSEQAFSRVRFAQFRELIHSDRVQLPALILVDERGSDPQLSYIVNPPDLSGDVLVCRFTSDPAELTGLRQHYGDRSWYVFKPAEQRLSEFHEDDQKEGHTPD